MVCVAITPRLSDADIDDIATGIIKVWHGQPKEIKI
jgi:hypothetical protein